MSRARRIHDLILRRAFVGVASLGLVTAFANFLCFMSDDSLRAQARDGELLLGALAVMVVAAVIHAHLAKEESPEN